jgi:primosomal protein N' (replication factor Y)
MCAIGDVYRGAMPSALLRVKLLSLKKQVVCTESELSDEEFLIYQALQQQSSLKVQDIINILNKKNIFPVIQKMIDKKCTSTSRRNTRKLQAKVSSIYSFARAI